MTREEDPATAGTGKSLQRHETDILDNIVTQISASSKVVVLRRLTVAISRRVISEIGPERTVEVLRSIKNRQNIVFNGPDDHQGAGLRVSRVPPRMKRQTFGAITMARQGYRGSV